MAQPERESIKQVAGGGKYLTFELNAETYGVEILKVKEIIGIMEITPVPHAPDCVKGVINLRGKIIPVVDLRVQFGFPPLEFTERTCIIVVDLEAGGVRTLVGAVVDAVAEVSQIPSTDIEPPPEMGDTAETSCIRGMAKVRDKVVILLGIDKVLGSALRGISQAA